MSKRQKKRNKPYTGADAALTTPHVRRYDLPERSSVAQWWHENKRMALVRGVLGAGALGLGWLIYSIIQ